MTAPVPSSTSPVPGVKKGAAGNVGSFAIDPNFLKNQTIKVYVRLKPPREDEKAPSADKKKKPKVDKKAWNMQKTGALDTLIQKGTARKVEGRTVFHFDQVFDEDAQTPLLYKSIARSMVHTVLNGKHATIFAYGQTGSGKTFTMQGDGKAQSGQAGIIQLVVSDMFRFMRMGAQSSRDFVIKVSYVEIYNERLRDLLSDDLGDNTSQGTPPGGTPASNGNSEVQIRTNAKGEVALTAETRLVHTVEDVLELLIYGNSQRVVARTDMNNHSSRSHAVFRLTVESSAKDVGPGAEVVRVADFNLVDLAGSESSKTANTTGKRQAEGGKINQSLLSLSNVINALSLPEKKRPKHINYRDSKLTRILQPHLQGNAEMAIICCASASKAFVEETRSTLKFGARAKLVTVTPKVNELNDDSALIKKLQTQLAEAKREIAQLRRASNSVGQPYTPSKPISETVTSGDTDEESYGYDDMDAGPGHREYNVVSNQEMPPPQAGPDESEATPGMGGRAYVMPKDINLPPELQRNYPAGEDKSSRSIKPPQNQEIPLDLGREFGERDSPSRANRKYVMPSNQEISHDMDQYLKGRVGESETDDEDSAGFENSGAFRLDAVDPEQADRTINRYMKGRTNTDSSDDVPQFYSDEEELSGLDRVSSTHGGKMRYSVDFPFPGQDKSGSRHDETGPTEDETFDGPEGSYAGVSMKFGTVVSRPDTLEGASTTAGRAKRSLGSVGNDDMHYGNKVSWDTMDLATMRPDEVGKPLKAIHSLYRRDAPLPEEITIMRLSVPDEQDELCLSEKLQNAEARAAFMQEKLEVADDLVEGIFKDLERARLCIHDMVYRNKLLTEKLKEKKREDVKEEYEEGEFVVEQYWLLKGSMYAGLFFFVAGGHEFFMATVFLVWLILEVNLGGTI